MFSARLLCWPASLEKTPFLRESRQGSRQKREVEEGRAGTAWPSVNGARHTGGCVSRWWTQGKSELGLVLWASCQGISGSPWAHPVLQPPRYLRGFSSLLAASCSISCPACSVSDLKFWMSVPFSIFFCGRNWEWFLFSQQKSGATWKDLVFPAVSALAVLNSIACILPCVYKS